MKATKPSSTPAKANGKLNQGGAFSLHSRNLRPLSRPQPDLVLVRVAVDSYSGELLDDLAAMTGLSGPQLAEFILVGPQPFRRLRKIVEARVQALADRREQLVSDATERAKGQPC